MKIAIDCDGVLYDFHGAYRLMLREYRGVEMPPIEESWTHWDAQKNYGTAADHKWMWNDGVALGLFRYGHIIKGAVIGCKQLYDAGHSLTVATHRNEDAVNDTLRFLTYMSEGMFKWSAVHIMSNLESKTSVPADVLIDDKRENLLEWAATGRTAIRFSRPWNNGFGYEGTGIIPAHGWKEVVEIVRELP